jgi:ribosomal protein S18 acetylase RimI-like enzyme
MTAAAQPLALRIPDTIRDFDLRRDLRPAADLIELCFAERLDEDGRRYVAQMRQAAGNRRLLRLAGVAPSSVTLPVNGLVWEEQGELVGNLSMLAVNVAGNRAYLIANVAVHPDHRRRGIAKTLTEEAIARIGARGIDEVWLHVDEDNDAARRLYDQLGFIEQARRTTWHVEPASNLQRLERGARFGGRRAKDWPKQEEWLRRLYPPRVIWHMPLRISLLRPGLGGALARFFSERRFQQWSAWQGRDLLGVCAWQSSHTQADWLWLAVEQEREEAAMQALLPQAFEKLKPRRTLALDYPTGRGEDILEQHGFRRHQTLIWMERGLPLS